jgi:hypothetical protein
LLLRKIAIMLREWRLLTKEEVAEQLLAWARELERRNAIPPQLTWEAKKSPGRRGDGAGNYGSVVNMLNAENVCNRPGSGSALMFVMMPVDGWNLCTERLL